MTSEESIKYARVLQGLIYALECNLATVEHFCLLSKQPKHEFSRQIAIAQSTINVFREIGYAIENYGRCGAIVKEYNWSVESWAKAMVERHS